MSENQQYKFAQLQNQSVYRRFIPKFFYEKTRDRYRNGIQKGKSNFPQDKTKYLGQDQDKDIIIIFNININLFRRKKVGMHLIKKNKKKRTTRTFFYK